RGSYRQWEEGGVPVTVAFEILSPDNSYRGMIKKFAFYEEYGGEEYYVYDPETKGLDGFLRKGGVLIRQRKPHDFVSPRLGIRFDLSGPEMVVYRPEGQRFLTFAELDAERKRECQQRLDAEQRADKAEQRADKAEQRADKVEQQLA